MKMNRLVLCFAVAALAVASCKKKKEETPAPVEEKIIAPEGAISVSGSVEGTWTKGKTYIVTEGITIEAGKSLTIQEGVTILMNTAKTPEVIVKGNLYSMGTAANPVRFTVPSDKKTEENKFGALWGGIIASPESQEIVIVHSILEYGGAVVTEESASLKAGLYKNESGENVPALYYNNGSGKLIFMNNIVRNFYEDGMYIEGGHLIIANNTFHTTGISGGEAVNLKSGVGADIAYNLIYSPNTNAFKLSNSGGKPQDSLMIYNNTVLNAGWRRPDIKGGSVWLEEGVYVKMANNLLANNRFGIKRDIVDTEDPRSKLFTTHYYGFTKTGVDQFQPGTDILAGTDDIISTETGANDPKFVNYPLKTASDNSTFDTAWDFHLQAGAPGLNKGKTSGFARRFPSGITVNGVTYIAPTMSNFIGAFGTK